MNYCRVFVAVFACSVAGCGSSDSDSGSPGGGGKGGSGGSSTGDPYYDAVPAEQRVADSGMCPGAYKGSAPVAGHNSGFDSGGQSRGFVLALPDSAKYPGPRPTFVLFNGTGENGNAIFQRAQAQAFVDKGFIVIAPDSAGNGTLWPVWDGLRQSGHENDPNLDLKLFDELLDCVAAHYSVDNKRIFIGGHSAGGIFTHHLIQRRSELIAGAIPGSGVFDLTAPSPPSELASTAVLTTWGGDNDSWGGSASGVQVPEFNFVEQAALSTQAYEKQPKVRQAWCRGNDLGHAWLSPINAWMADFLLAHPKGLAQNSPWQFTPPNSPAATCGNGPVDLPKGPQVLCPGSATSGCQEYCQFLGDCAAENATIEPILGPQLTALGFSGDGHKECGGCVTACAADAAKAAGDTDVLGCFKADFVKAVCGPGIPGAEPFIAASNKCCQGKTQSPVCKRLCETIKTNSSASLLFTACQAF